MGEEEEDVVRLPPLFPFSSLLSFHFYLQGLLVRSKGVFFVVDGFRGGLPIYNLFLSRSLFVQKWPCVLMYAVSDPASLVV